MQPLHDTGTKARLLEAGRVIFAQHGPEKARVRDICAMAGTNVAAVNYHFGSKERLYMTVLSVNLGMNKERHPLDVGITAESTPEERLRAFINGMLHHFLDEDEISARLGRLVLQEALEPSEHFKEIVDQHFRPCNLMLRDIVMEFMPGAPNEVVARCTSNIVSQFVMYRFHRQVRESLGPEFSLGNETFDVVADAIYELSLGGIQRLSSLYSK